MTGLGCTFDITGAAWNWMDDERTFGGEITPATAEVFLLDDWSDDDMGDLLRRHPLCTWLFDTGDPSPQTLGRVPQSAAGRRDFAMIKNLLAPSGCDQQLSITYRLGASSYRTFVLARPTRDFDDDDLEVARRIQPLFRAIDTQARILCVLTPTSSTGSNAAAPARLSPRELAVLQLLVQGHTASSIAARLGSSPRTVEKHLQSIYRKLEVNDRLGAVRVAVASQLVIPATYHRGDFAAPLSRCSTPLTLRRYGQAEPTP